MQELCRDVSLIPGQVRSPGEGHGSPLQQSCLENPHGQRSREGYSVRNDLATKHIAPFTTYVFLTASKLFTLNYKPHWFFSQFFKQDQIFLASGHLQMQFPEALQGFPGGTSGKEPDCQCRRLKTCGVDPCVGKISWRRTWKPTPVFLPKKSHGQRSLVGYGPQGCKESDMTEAT